MGLARAPPEPGAHGIDNQARIIEELLEELAFLLLVLDNNSAKNCGETLHPFSAEGRVADEYLGEHHVYRPHRAGLPPLGRYVGEFWKRRAFVRELARAELKAQNYQTAFGQLWLVLNPLLNPSVRKKTQAQTPRISNEIGA